MSIVVITIPGNAQKDFVNSLHRETNGAVELVIIQLPKRASLFERIVRFYRAAKKTHFVKELWYALLLRLNPRLRKALSNFQAKGTDPGEAYLPKVMRVDSINSDEVFRTIQSISPDVLAVWGSTVLEPRLLSVARHAVNLHFGISPHYRGALANQHAVLNGDYAHVGATIHYMADKVDSGRVLDQYRISPALPSEESLSRLTTIAPRRFIDVIKKLHAGENLPARTQEARKSQVLLLRDWVPSMRWAVGSRLIEHR
jgi:folate-dependent phosphoribosylglycinamide formyltransferase PurN